MDQHIDNLEHRPVLREIVRILVISLAALLLAVNINTFVHTGGLYPGGATGLTVLVQRIGEQYWGIHLPYTLINLIMNAFPVYIGFRYIGKKFTFYTLIFIMVSNIFTDLVPTHVITYDPLLISIFGGIINGTVVGVSLLAGAATGGLDFISMFFNVRKGIDGFYVSLGCNVVILSVAGLIFGWEKALYSIILQFVTTQMIHIIYQQYQQHTILIVTEKPKEIAEMIYSVCHHGATILDAEGAYEHGEKKFVYSVVSSADRGTIVRMVSEIDPAAFINVIKTERIQGHFYQKPTK